MQYTKIAVIAHPTVNGWFSVEAFDEAGNKFMLKEGSDLGSTLTYAACLLGTPLVFPLSGARHSLLNNPVFGAVKPLR